MSIMDAVAEQLERGKSLEELVGVGDARKVESSVSYFNDVANIIGDVELQHLLVRVQNES